MERVLHASAAALLCCLAAMSSAPAASAASAPYDPHTVLVRYADGAPPAQRSLAGRLAGVLETIAPVARAGADLVRVTGDPAAVAARLNRSPSVLYAEPNYIVRASAPALPDDARFGELYGLNNSGQSGGTADADIDAPEGWGSVPALAAFPSSGGVKVGIVDTGATPAHEDLVDKVSDCAGAKSFGINLLIITLFADPTIVAGKCADDNGHGTHVAGTIAARANNAKGVAGVAFNSPLAICKALDSSGAGTVAAIANCITYLASVGSKVISMSLGTTADSATLANAVASASSSALLVAAAGNGGDGALNYPAAYPQVVSVAATDRNDAHASFSTFNSDVEIAAPGVDVLSTWNDGGYRAISGTSMATPHVAGVAALIAGRLGGGPAAWRAKLDLAVDDLGAFGRDPQFGFGRVNLAKALAP
jgi:thermitase